jgi:hypothetical protein
VSKQHALPLMENFDMQYFRTSLARPASWLIQALVLIFIAGFASAGMAEEKKAADRLPELVRLTGQDAFFDHYGDMMKQTANAGPKQRKPQAEPDKRFEAAWVQAVDVALAPESLRREWLAEMEGKLSDDDLDKIFAFYRSPLGIMMNALEMADGAKSMLDPGAQKKDIPWLRIQLEEDRERARILKLLERAEETTEGERDVAVGGMRAMLIAMRAARLDAATALPAEAIRDIDAQVDKMFPAAKSRMNAVLSLAYRYRQASTAELRQYLAFLNTPAGKKMTSAIISATKQTLIKTNADLGQAVMTKLRRKENS